MTVAEAQQLKAGETIYFHGDTNAIAWGGIYKGTFLRYVNDETHFVFSIKTPASTELHYFIYGSDAYLDIDSARAGALARILQEENDPTCNFRKITHPPETEEIIERARQKMYDSRRERLEAQATGER